jgi:hypothetical protein
MKFRAYPSAVKKQPTTEAFRLCLEQTIQEYQPAFVAEEYQ